MQRIRRKIEELRQQPEHVRFRAVSYLTVVSGVIVVALWLTVFLPLQLYWQRGGSNDQGQPPVAEQNNNTNNQIGNTEQLPNQPLQPQVGGVVDPYPSPSPSLVPTIDFQPSATPPVDVPPQ